MFQNKDANNYNFTKYMIFFFSFKQLEINYTCEVNFKEKKYLLL